jgi:mRNA interferase RelE/StbE
VSSDEAGAIVIDVAEVWAMGARSESEVCQEAHHHVTTLPRSPLTVTLTDVIKRWGTIGVEFEMALEPVPSEPLPPWLADRLTRQAGIPSTEVMSLTQEDAIRAWERWMSGRRG